MYLKSCQGDYQDHFRISIVITGEVPKNGMPIGVIQSLQYDNLARECKLYKVYCIQVLFPQFKVSIGHLLMI